MKRWVAHDLVKFGSLAALITSGAYAATQAASWIAFVYYKTQGWNWPEAASLTAIGVLSIALAGLVLCLRWFLGVIERRTSVAPIAKSVPAGSQAEELSLSPGSTSSSIS